MKRPGRLLLSFVRFMANA